MTYDLFEAVHNPDLGDDDMDEENIHTVRLGPGSSPPRPLHASNGLYAVPGSSQARARDFLSGSPYTAETNRIGFIIQGLTNQVRISMCDGRLRKHSYKARTPSGAETRVVVNYVCHVSEVCEVKRRCARDLALEAAKCIFGAGSV